MLLLSLLTASVLAAPPQPGDISVQYGVCVQCHGAHGEGRPELGAPRIGDLDAGYIAAQLTAFRDGSRGDHPAARPMTAVAKGLPEASIPALSEYVASLHPQVYAPQESPSGGAAAYSVCASCHGADAKGNSALNAPNLQQQGAPYLTKQLVDYREGRRGGPSAAPLAQAMAAQASALSDAQIDVLVQHIASLRPEPPAPEHPPVTETTEAGLAAFSEIYAVATHPRCLNCHPDGDAPLQTDASLPHSSGITRFSPLEGVHCSTCHAPFPVGDGQAPLPPADPVWSMPPKAMAFQHRTPAALCAQLQNPDVNGGRGLISLTEHVESDHLLLTSWHSGRTPPPITHEALVAQFVVWAAAGAPCPAE